MICLNYIDTASLASQGRPFSCKACLTNPQSKGKERLSIANARRCFEDRWDFTEKDGAAFPIQLITGGPQFGFCPAKVARDDPQTLMIYNTLIAIIETGTWPEDGGINDQDIFWVELVSQFSPYIDQTKWNYRLSVIVELVNQAFGGKKKTNQGGLGSGTRKK